MAVHNRDCEELEEDTEQTEEETEAEEEKPLVLRTTKVVEYLEPMMSVELLCKFPDNSAYDFDYSQSTIWSPLVIPRPYSTPITIMDLELGHITPKKLSYELGATRRSSVKKVGSKLKKKFTTTTALSFNLNLDICKKKQNKKKKKKGSDLSPTPSGIKNACNPTIKKGWDKVLKVASKQFKRWKVKRDPIAHVMLTKSFRDGGDF